MSWVRFRRWYRTITSTLAAQISRKVVRTRLMLVSSFATLTKRPGIPVVAQELAIAANQRDTMLTFPEKIMQWVIKPPKRLRRHFSMTIRLVCGALTGFEARYNRMLVTYETLVSYIEMNSSVTKAIDLLEGSARSKKPAALKDLARNTGLNKATAYRLLYSLCQPGLVHKSADAMLSQAEILAIIKTRRAGKLTRPVF